MKIYIDNHRYTQDWNGIRLEADVEFWVESTNDILEYEKLMRDCGAGPFELDRFRRLFNIKPREYTLPSIKNVYFNDPMTVVLWNDGSKTIVRCQKGDTYSKETGLSLCIAKKALGNKPNFNDIFKKWIPKEKKPVRGLRSKLNLDERDKMENTSDKLYRYVKEACAPGEDKEKTVKKVCRNCKFYNCWYFEHPCSECVRNLDHSGARDYWTSAK